MIRKAIKSDIHRIIELLHQVNMVHFEIRPDLFRPHTTKYDEQELENLFCDPYKPVFVYDDGIVLGYAFCQITVVRNHLLLQDTKTLYIDDICVDETARGRHIGKALFDYVHDYAQSIGCHNITLNVWEGNDAALNFYRNQGMTVQKTTMELLLPTIKEIFLAGGCFWGTEHYFKQIEGVVKTEVGFANGHTENPTYKEVYTDATGYAETVRVGYNPDVVSLEFLLRMFFKAIDPTSLNRQGHDEGTRYRTGIYYNNPDDLPIINKVYAEKQQHYDQPFAVEKLPLENFYAAEEYHQDYLEKNPTGYCHLPQSLFEFARKAKEKKHVL